MILNYQDRLDGVWSMMKTRHENDMINHGGLLYIENET